MPRLPSSALLASTLLLAAPAPPARAADAGALFGAESRFQGAVASDGVPAGFLAFLADSAVVLSPEPRPARALYEALADDGARLVWRPDVGTLAAAGDFGWTSGPWLRFTAGATVAGEAGYFFTVWRRNAGGDWQVILDAGAAYPLPAADRDRHLSVTARSRPAGGGLRDVASCDERFTDEWRTRGRARALKDFAARDLRLLHAGRAPVDARPGADDAPDAPLAAARITRRLASAAGDLVVAYGVYEYGATAERGRARESFALAFDAGHDCRLALEIRLPADPSR